MKAHHIYHLGTGTLITDATGEAYQFFMNLPFGETMIEQGGYDYDNPYKFNDYGSKKIKYLFTKRIQRSCELDQETGLYYYGARYYDPKISMWSSVDPLAEKYPSFNPYNYVLNNPVMLVDPTGMEGETHYYNKKTGEHIYVDDGFKDKVVLVDNKDWSSVQAAKRTGTLLITLHLKGSVDITIPDNYHNSYYSQHGSLIYLPGKKIENYKISLENKLKFERKIFSGAFFGDLGGYLLGKAYNKTKLYRKMTSLLEGVAEEEMVAFTFTLAVYSKLLSSQRDKAINSLSIYGSKNGSIFNYATKLNIEGVFVRQVSRSVHSGIIGCSGGTAEYLFYFPNNPELNLRFEYKEF